MLHQHANSNLYWINCNSVHYIFRAPFYMTHDVVFYIQNVPNHFRRKLHMQKVAKQELVFTWVQEHCGIWPPVVMCMWIFIIYYPVWWHNGPIMGWWTGWCHNGTLMALDPASQFISYWNLLEEADMERLQINKWAHYLWCTFILCTVHDFTKLCQKNLSFHNAPFPLLCPELALPGRISAIK